MRWLIHEWPYAALFTAVFLLLMLPFISPLGLALTLIYLQLPLYMLHQFEEHDQDRFRKFANQWLAGGKEAFTPLGIFVINSAGVWGLDLLALYLAFYVDLAFGLVAIYLPLVNAVSHIVAALVKRCYNPGLWTSLVLFLPLGGWALMVVSKACQAGWTQQAAALTAAILVHALIMGYVKLRLRKLKA